MTPSQEQELKLAVSGVKSSGIFDTSQILHTLRYTPFTVSFSGRSQARGDKVLVQMEKFISGLAVEYSLSKTDSPAQLNTKWDSAVAAAPNAAAKLEVARDESKFWSFYGILRTVDVLATDNEIIQVPIITYGMPIIGFEINGNDIERVQQ